MPQLQSFDHEGLARKELLKIARITVNAACAVPSHFHNHVGRSSSALEMFSQDFSN